MKYVIKYNIDGRQFERTVYITDKLCKNPHRTTGKSKLLGGVAKMYIRQGRIVIRTPGVYRRSAHVEDVNKLLERNRGASSPAAKCAGLPWKGFKRCLREQFRSMFKAGNYTYVKSEPISADQWYAMMSGTE